MPLLTHWLICSHTDSVICMLNVFMIRTNVDDMHASLSYMQTISMVIKRPHKKRKVGVE